MISARRVKVMSLALLMSAGTVVLTQQWLKNAVHQATVEARSESPGRTPVSTTRVLVAAAPLPAGSVLTAQSLRWQSWPQASSTGYLTEGSVQLGQLAGAVVRTPLDSGEPITSARIALPGDRGTMATELQPGYRAVTVNVTAATGVAGFVSPGDRVDVVLTRSLGQPGARGPNLVSETVLSDVRVLGVDQKAAPTDPKPSAANNAPVVPQTATLEVTPKGAEVVALASELGRVSLSLRSLADVPAAEPHRTVTRTASVDGDAPPGPRPATRRARAAVPTIVAVEVVRGDQSSRIAAR